MLFFGILIEAAQTSVPTNLPNTWPAVVALGLFLLFSNVGMWIRELMKHKDWKKKNGSEKATAATVKDIDAKVGLLIEGQAEVRTNVKNIQTNCIERATICTNRMEHSEEMIFQLAKDGKKE